MLSFNTFFYSALFALFFFSSSIQANELFLSRTGSLQSIKAQKKQLFSLDFSYANAKELWAKDDKIKYNEGKAATNKFGIQAYYHRALDNKFSIMAHLGFISSQISGGSFSNRRDGDSTTQISSYGLQLERTIYTPQIFQNLYNLKAFVGLRFPGDGSAYDFLALHDGSKKLDLGLHQSFSFRDIHILSSIQYSFREAGLANQFQLSLASPIRFTKELHVGPNFVYFNTLGGIDFDLSSNSLFNQRSRVHGGPSFPELNENFIAAGALVSFDFTETLAVQGTYLQKTQGKNTDKSSQFSLKMTHVF